MTVIAWISHKGGTGRTVALVNTAFQMTRPGPERRHGHSVVCVDLDLASPTMGSVLGWPEFADGADEGVHDLLPVKQILPLQDGNGVDRLVKNVWDSPVLGSFAPLGETRFGFLPGKRGVGDVFVSNPEQTEQLLVALQNLNEQYDFVFLDVRSGLSNIGGDIARGTLQEITDGWIVMHRWTPQHLAGARELIGKLRGHGWTSDQMMIVESARMRPSEIPDGPDARRAWVTARDIELDRTRLDLFEPFQVTSESPVTVPDELILRWHECVITPDMVEAGMASREVFAAFGQIGNRVEERVWG